MVKLLHLLRRYWRELLLLLLILAPLLAAFTLGFVWLWQAGWLLYWWLGVVLFTVAPMFLIPAFWRPPAHGVSSNAAAPGDSPAEQQARAALQELMVTVRSEDAESSAALQRLVQRTINRVAVAYLPDHAEADKVMVAGLSRAALHFTLPEILLMSEDLSRRLRQTLVSEFPVLRHTEIGWVLESYEQGSEVGQKVRDIYRVARWVNPLSALLGVVKEAALSRAFAILGAAARAQCAALVVREVGESAIRLYSGHYRRATEELAQPPLAEEEGSAEESPITLLLAGRAQSGKSSLVNALLGREAALVGPFPAAPVRALTFTGEREPFGPLRLIDTPPLEEYPAKEWLKGTEEADLLLWVTPLHRADRAAEQRALAQLRAAMVADPRSRPLPLLVVATHADRLAPLLEWSPPYDPERGERQKEVQMRAARQALLTVLGVAPEACVVVALGEGEPPWNLEAVWALLAGNLSHARQQQLARRRRAEGVAKQVVDGVRSLPGVWRQAVRFVRR